jgi:hypothetical protein
VWEKQMMLSFCAWLIFLTNSLYCHSCCCESYDFILLYDWIIASYVLCCVFFIHLSANGHLGRFSIVATGNSGTMSIGMQIFFCTLILFPLNIYSRIG